MRGKGEQFCLPVTTPRSAMADNGDSLLQDHSQTSLCLCARGAAAPQQRLADERHQPRRRHGGHLLRQRVRQLRASLLFRRGAVHLPAGPPLQSVPGITSWAPVITVTCASYAQCGGAQCLHSQGRSVRSTAVRPLPKRSVIAA